MKAEQQKRIDDLKAKLPAPFTSVTGSQGVPGSSLNFFIGTGCAISIFRPTIDECLAAADEWLTFFAVDIPAPIDPANEPAPSIPVVVSADGKTIEIESMVYFPDPTLNAALIGKVKAFVTQEDKPTYVLCECEELLVGQFIADASILYVSMEEMQKDFIDKVPLNVAENGAASPDADAPPIHLGKGEAPKEITDSAFSEGLIYGLDLNVPEVLAKIEDRNKNGKITRDEVRAYVKRNKIELVKSE